MSTTPTTTPAPTLTRDRLKSMYRRPFPQDLHIVRMERRKSGVKTLVSRRRAHIVDSEVLARIKNMSHVEIIS